MYFFMDIIYILIDFIIKKACYNNNGFGPTFGGNILI